MRTVVVGQSSIEGHGCRARVRRYAPGVTSTPAIVAAERAGLEHLVVSYGPVSDIHEAAERRGIDVAHILKTMLVRRGEGDHLFVLVPGDRIIDWPLLRAHLGVSRISMLDAAEALEVTGYPRGAITPLGARRALQVVADKRLLQAPLASIGGGAHGVALHVDPQVLVDHLAAGVADVTRPARKGSLSGGS